MKSLLNTALLAATLLAASVNFTLAQDLDAAVQSKVDAVAKQIQTWAADPVLVSAVKACNTTPSADTAAMTQDKWKTLPILDPVVRSFSKTPAGEFLKAKKTAAVSEAFLSAADGKKVAFLTKPTSWSHQGKPKHDVPMTGKTWQGPVEVDESSGLQQVQVAVPVLDGGKPIGSLVVGLSLSKLGKE